jgi:hypothetical protein
MNDLMFNAIVNDRCDFVKAFLEHGCSMSHFLSHRRLIKLYNEVSINILLHFSYIFN